MIIGRSTIKEWKDWITSEGDRIRPEHQEYVLENFLEALEKLELLSNTSEDGEEKQSENIGQAVIELLNLKLNKDTSRYDTSIGNKTVLGLGRTIKRIAQ